MSYTGVVSVSVTVSKHIVSPMLKSQYLIRTVYCVMTQSQSCMFCIVPLNATSQHAVSKTGVPACCWMCNCTVKASCLACYSCSNEQLLSCAATARLVVGNFAAMTLLFCFCRPTALVVLGILHSGHLWGCTLSEQSLQGEDSYVMLYAALGIYANDTSMLDSLVFAALPLLMQSQCKESVDGISLHVL